MSDSELTRMQHEWQRLGGDAALGDLTERATREVRRARRNLVLEVLAAAFSTGLFTWMTVRSHGALDVTGLAAAVLVFNGMSLVKLLEANAWQSELGAVGVSAFAEKLRWYLTTRQRRLDFGWRASVVLTLLVAAWSPIWVLRHLAVYRLEPWRGVVGFGTAAAILVGAFVWMGMQRRKVALELVRFDEEIARISLD